MSLSLCLFGLVLGMRHALEPDHVAAVSTLVAERRRSSSGAVLGGFWGLGHTAALLAVTALLGAVGATMPARLATMFELAVAFMLIAIGIRSLVRARAAGGPPATAAAGRRHWSFARRSLLVGLVHGLAGSGALTALIASRMPSPAGRLFYVALFGLGSVVGMTALSGVVGWPLSRIGRNPAVARILMIATGAFACGLGFVWGVPLVRELLG
jgi:hypothetical protein